MNKEKDITGNKYNHLTAIKRDGNDSSGCAAWIFQCDCGRYHRTRKKAVTSGQIRSCGKCIPYIRKSEGYRRPPVIIKHGMSNTKLYRVWHGMKMRCNPKRKSHRSRYYDRGITVCEEWANSFEKFYEWAIANGYKEGLTIDRINNDGIYEPSNCRWTTTYIQARNKRSNVMVEHNGKTLCISDWEKELGYGNDSLGRRYRMGDRGDFLFRPKGERRDKGVKKK